MPKATLSFQLPEEQDEFNNTLKAGALHGAAWNFQEWLRAKRKYENLTSLKIEEIEKVFRDEFEGLLE